LATAYIIRHFCICVLWHSICSRHIRQGASNHDCD